MQGAASTMISRAATFGLLDRRQLAVQEVSSFAALQAAVAAAPTTGELYEIEVSADIDVTAQITADGGRNVLIVGKAGAHYVLDAKASNRIFYIASGSSLTARNLELANGYVASVVLTESRGGILHSQ